MTAVVSTRCRRCGAELTDRFSRKLGYGPECRKDLTPEQIADAVRANQPGYVPRAQPVSIQARINRADALAAVDEVVECGCGSGAQAGRCPECRAEQTDPMGVLAKRVQRVIERIRAARTAERGGGPLSAPQRWAAGLARLRLRLGPTHRTAPGLAETRRTRGRTTPDRRRRRQRVVDLHPGTGRAPARTRHGRREHADPARLRDRRRRGDRPAPTAYEEVTRT